MDQETDQPIEEIEAPLPPAEPAAPRRWDRRLIIRVVVAILVTGLTAWILARAPDPDRELLPGELRIVTVEPSGTLGNAPIFIWRPVRGATWYDFEIAAADGLLIYAQRTNDTLHAPPSTVPYAEGREYVWSVRSRLTDGTWARALPRRFRIIQ